MNSLNFSFTIQAIDEFKIIKDETRQIKELLLNVYGVSDDSLNLPISRESHVVTSCCDVVAARR